MNQDEIEELEDDINTDEVKDLENKHLMQEWDTYFKDFEPADMMTVEIKARSEEVS